MQETKKENASKESTDDVVESTDDDLNDHEFNDAEDEIHVTDIDDLDADDADSQEQLAEIEANTAPADSGESVHRYQHNSEIFGSTEVSTGRAKLELLEEERRLKEMLNDSF